MAITRRQFMKGVAIAGGAMMMPGLGPFVRNSYAFAKSPQLKKWVQPIQGLGDTGIPVMTSVPDGIIPNTMFYDIGVAEFQQILHPHLGPTTLWGYYDKGTLAPVKRHLGGVIAATRGIHSRLRVTNELPGVHIFPVDTTVPMPAAQQHNRICVHQHGGYMPWWADGGPHHWFTPAGAAYASGLSFIQGPGTQNPLAHNDGYLIAQGQADYFYPNFQSTRLTWYHDHAWGITRLNAYAGIASAYLIIDPFQDAQLGNVPTDLGVDWFPLVFQDKIFVNPATLLGPAGTDPTWAQFAPAKSQTLGSLWYEHIYDPKVFRLFKGGKNTLTPPNPSAVPEFFGDTMLCNGTVYPMFEVEAKPYRFTILNACNARFLNINLLRALPSTGTGLTGTFPDVPTDPKTLFAAAGTQPGPNMTQIGTEGGYLLRPVTYRGANPVNPLTNTGQLLVGCGERVDIVIDFSGLAGREYIFYNDAPGPFPGGAPTFDYFLGNPKNPVQPLLGTGPDTRQILRFKVIAGPGIPGAKPITLPATLDPNPAQWLNWPPPPPAPVAGLPRPPYAPLTLKAGVTAFARPLTLNEAFDAYGRLAQLLGTTTPAAAGGFGLEYMADATELIPAGRLEVWQIFNVTADTHPMHFHLVNGMVLSRQPFKLTGGTFAPSGVAQGPEQDELGWKETIKMHPGTVTSVLFKFDLPENDPDFPSTEVRVPNSTRTGGKEYVWHCHILEHEEHDMMRPLVVI